MMNERGFVYPVTLVIFTLFSLFLLMQWNQYVTEKRFSADIKYHEKKQFYFLQSIKKLEGLLSGDALLKEGSFKYKDGVVSYKTNEMGGNLVQVTFYVEIDSREEMIGLGYFDRDLKRMIKWMEKD